MAKSSLECDSCPFKGSGSGDSGGGRKKAGASSWGSLTHGLGAVEPNGEKGKGPERPQVPSSF